MFSDFEHIKWRKVLTIDVLFPTCTLTIKKENNFEKDYSFAIFSHSDGVKVI